MGRSQKRRNGHCPQTHQNPGKGFRLSPTRRLRSRDLGTYILANREPIYVLYGHAATDWTDASSGAGTRSFRFRCSYSIKWKPGDIIQGEPIGLVAPFYNATREDTHLHPGVFKPKKDRNGSFYGPPSTGWEWGGAGLRTGDFIDPEVFFTECCLLDEIG